ncbi:MAG: methyltransferase domain-containing protein [Thiomargarita sp.]|nr:methyltransferase domain-containing protein [Thiomargarita sp.]
MIQRNISKAKLFINQSVARVRDVSLSRVFIDSIRETSILSKNEQSKSPAWVLFAREALRNPRTIGTGWASSTRLARTIANSVPLDDDALIVELGGGTGIVTVALLERGIKPENLISIEQSASLADYLRQRCPKIRVIQGDALHLSDLLGEDVHRVKAIVSGLPFRSLPDIVKHGIIKQIDNILPKDGSLVQFTYDLSGRAYIFTKHFKYISHKMVWGNLPPARVDIYHPKS